MTRSLALALALTGLAAGCKQPVPREITDPTPEMEAVVDANNTFGGDVYGAVMDEDEDNLFYSPFSITSALGMTLAGAAGDTEAEMTTVLHVEGEQSDFHANLGALSRDLDGTDKHRGYELAIANGLWGQDGVPWKQPFLTTLDEDYGAPLEGADFAGNADAERQRINDWVAEQTADKIQDLFPSDAINASTVLVLANAIYFKADWSKAFDKGDTADSTFTLLDGTEVQTPTMFQTEDFRFAEGTGYRALSMPYQDDEVSMVVLLPEGHDGLSVVEDAYVSGEVYEVLDQLAETEVRVGLPRFELKYKRELTDVLEGLGMESAFTAGQADFTDMADLDLFLQTVIHQAYVKVDEEGTEAAAATGVAVGETSAGPEAVEFIADHPFLFLIRDDLTGAVLFAGRVTDPRAPGIE